MEEIKQKLIKQITKNKEKEKPKQTDTNRNLPKTNWKW